MSAQAVARSYFKVNPNVLENIRDIINKGNQDALQSVSTEVLNKIQQLVEAEFEKFRFLGQKPRFAVKSCKDINDLQPCTASGYYWIDTESNPLGIWCEMNPDKFNATGGFMKIVQLDMRNNASMCPKGLQEIVPPGSPKRLCASPSTAAGAASIKFDTHCVNYTKVCGKITGYQYYSTEAFYSYAISRSIATLELNYVDGVSVTHGTPRKHIWTLASGMDEVRTTSDISKACPCSNTEVDYTGRLPPFINNDYYCETGSRGAAQNKYYLNDPLWDGEGCGPDSTCCNHNGWWCKELGYSTSDDIELRIITNSAKTDENILLETVELYIQ